MTFKLFFFAYGKAHSGSFVLGASAVKSLEGGKNLFNVLLIETNTIILNDDLKPFIRCVAPYFNDRLFAEKRDLPCKGWIGAFHLRSLELLSAVF